MCQPVDRPPIPTPSYAEEWLAAIHDRLTEIRDRLPGSVDTEVVAAAQAVTQLAEPAVSAAPSEQVELREPAPATPGPVRTRQRTRGGNRA